jgi:hypothetical protein
VEEQDLHRRVEEARGAEERLGLLVYSPRDLRTGRYLNRLLHVHVHVKFLKRSHLNP